MMPALKLVKEALLPPLEAYPNNSLQQYPSLYKDFLVLQHSTTITTRLEEAHNSPIRCHRGYLKVYEQIAPQFYWISMSKDILVLTSQMSMNIPYAILTRLVLTSTSGSIAAITHTAKYLGRSINGIH